MGRERERGGGGIEKRQKDIQRETETIERDREREGGMEKRKKDIKRETEEI